MKIKININFSFFGIIYKIIYVFIWKILQGLEFSILLPFVLIFSSVLPLAVGLVLASVDSIGITIPAIIIKKIIIVLMVLNFYLFGFFAIFEAPYQKCKLLSEKQSNTLLLISYFLKVVIFSIPLIIAIFSPFDFVEIVKRFIIAFFISIFI